jgi:hypothetical protein
MKSALIYIAYIADVKEPSAADWLVLEGGQRHRAPPNLVIVTR